MSPSVFSEGSDRSIWVWRCLCGITSSLCSFCCSRLVPTGTSFGEKGIKLGINSTQHNTTQKCWGGSLRVQTEKLLDSSTSNTELENLMLSAWTQWKRRSDVSHEQKTKLQDPPSFSYLWYLFASSSTVTVAFLISQSLLEASTFLGFLSVFHFMHFCIGIQQKRTVRRKKRGNASSTSKVSPFFFFKRIWCCLLWKCDMIQCLLFLFLLCSKRKRKDFKNKD